MRARNTLRTPAGGPVDHLDSGIDLVRLARQGAQEGGGLRAILRFSEDPAVQDDLGVGGDHDAARRCCGDSLRLGPRRPGNETQRAERRGRPLIDAGGDGAKRDA